MDNFEEQIEEFGTNYMKDSFLSKTFTPYEYKSGRIPIGTDQLGNEFCIEWDDAIRMIIVGKPGSGKTFLLRGIMDRLTKVPLSKTQIGYAIFIPTDIKDEFKSSKRPVQHKFRKMHLPGELAEGQNISTLRPSFFKYVNKRLPKQNHWMAVDISKMEEYDFMTLLNADKMREPQRIITQNLYDELKKETNFNMGRLKEILDGMLGQYDEKQVKALQNKLQPLFNSGFGDSRYFRDLVKGINSGKEVEVIEDDVPRMVKHSKIIALNMEDYDLLGKGSFLYTEVFVGMALRQLLIARRRGYIPPIWVLLDEAGRFIPKDSNPSCKKDIMESDKRDRKNNVSYIYATQYFTDLPDEIKQTSKYIFLPYNVDTGIIKSVLSFTGMVTNNFVQNIASDSNRLKSQLGHRQWLVFNTDTREKRIINLNAPLSEHTETSK